MILTLDIETLPTSDASVIAEFEATIKAPAQYKKPDSIAEWMKDNKEASLAEMLAKTSFDGMYGSIACICFAFDDEKVCGLSSRYQGSEKEMLEIFYRHVDSMSKVEHHSGTTSVPVTVCGHNVAGFDLPFLKHRSIILGVKPPAVLLKAMNAKPWDTCIADTMLMWSSDTHKRGSMDRLCKALGIPGKGDFDGSMVAATWPNDPDKVIEYCKQDVERTRQIYKRITFQG